MILAGRPEVGAIGRDAVAIEPAGWQ
jgi:hypothetical protein